VLTGKNKSTSNYVDILHRIIGIQKYQNLYYPEKSNDDVVDARKNEYLCNKLYGALIGSPQIFNSSIWSQIQSYKNPEVNETYTATKLNQNNEIFPHFIDSSIKTTKYSELPVWKISNDWPIFSFNIGTSDASRFNSFIAFPHLDELSIRGTNALDPQIVAAAKNLFEVNDADIYRHGPRNKISHVYTTVKELNNKNKEPSGEIWTKLISDFYLDGHLKYNGTIDMAGVQDCICVGDNLRVSNKLFHIEQVNHRYIQSQEGTRSFVTSISISRGIGIEDTSQDDKMLVGKTSESGSND
jgi:hypothetical protein